MNLKVASTEVRLVRIETALAMVQAAVERIESKLDALTKDLAEDEQDEDSGVDLEGSPLPADRDPHEPL